MRAISARVLFSSFLSMTALLTIAFMPGVAFSADQPAAPAVSTFANVKALAGQVDTYVEKLEESVENEDEYKDSKEKIAKDANTLIVIALALGVSDENNAYKSSAAGIVKAAQDLAAAKDFSAAKAGVAAVKTAAEAKTCGADKLKWEKTASLAELMKAVPTINTKLKGALRREKRFKRTAKKGVGYAAVLAVIAQGAMANSADTDKPEEAEQWFKFCADMRDAAGEVGTACVKKNHAEAQAAMEKLDQTCHACHAVFHEEELEK